VEDTGWYGPFLEEEKKGTKGGLEDEELEKVRNYLHILVFLLITFFFLTCLFTYSAHSQLFIPVLKRYICGAIDLHFASWFFLLPTSCFALLAWFAIVW